MQLKPHENGAVFSFFLYVYFIAGETFKDHLYRNAREPLRVFGVFLFFKLMDSIS